MSIFCKPYFVECNSFSLLMGQTTISNLKTEIISKIITSFNEIDIVIPQVWQCYETHITHLIKIWLQLQITIAFLYCSEHAHNCWFAIIMVLFYIKRAITGHCVV